MPRADVPSAVLVVPGSLDGRTGGYAYDRAIADGLRARGWSIDVRELDGSFPRPSPGALDRAAQAFDAIPARTIALVDSLAFGAMPDIIVRHASRLRIVALVHLPLAADVGLEPGESARFEEAERRALEAAARIVVTGKGALPLLERYRLAPERVAVVEPGTERAPLARGSSGLPLQLLTVATLNPGKGHEDLLTALASVPRRQWRLTCAGSLTRHPATAERVRAAIDRLALSDRVVLAGELEGPALEACYDGADLFVLATRQETYGMAVAEALAHGLPVVSTTTGAIPDLVGEDAGLLVAPGDTAALSDALSRVLCDDELRVSLARGARQRRTMLRGWEEATAEMAAVLESCLAEAPKGEGGRLSDWLRLREAADWTSRSSRLVHRINEGLVTADRIHVLDLCTGTGSNLRYLIDRLPGRQRWLAVDRDASLLEEVPGRLALWAGERGLTTVTDSTGVHIRGNHLECDVEIRQMNVASLDEAIFEGRHLVTASALLDLASGGWLTLLAERCRAVRASALFTITYDGSTSCDPPEPEDEIVLRLFNQHQRRDKGLGGPAAGPGAWAAAVRVFEDAGYSVESAPSDWLLEPAEHVFQKELIEGWARAAAEIAPERTALVDDWLRRRLIHVDAGRSQLTVGHRDIAAWR